MNLQVSGRRLLLAGFGGLLLLMLIAGVDAVMVLRDVRAKDAQERDLYLRRATALDQVRTGIYQSAIAMRAYLLADNAREAAAQLGQWDGCAAPPTRRWSECAAVLDPADAPQLASLRIEVQDYWRLLDFLAHHPGEGPPRAGRRLSESRSGAAARRHPGSGGSHRSDERAPDDGRGRPS